MKFRSLTGSCRKALAIVAIAGGVGMGPLALAAPVVAPLSAQVKATYADRANFAAKAAISSDNTTTRFIVTYHEGSVERQTLSLAQQDFSRVGAVTGSEVKLVRTLATGAHLVELRRAAATHVARPVDDDMVDSVMVEFAKNPSVAYVEPDRMMTIKMTPNDTRYSEQWDLFEAVGGANVPGAWDIATGTGVVVAVIDTGITPHSDLAGQTIGGYDFISDTTVSVDGNGRDANPNDEGDWYTGSACGPTAPPSENSSWHGTHVAGTIAALTNNSRGVAGIAFGAKVEPVRVLGKCGGSVSDIVDAIEWASGGTVAGVPANPNPARVINMSLGGGGACGSFQTAVNDARSRGTVIVAAAGNENQNASNSSPGNCTGVITVAATNRSGGRASYSNYGTIVSVAAPGGNGSGNANDILSTLNAGTTTQGAETYALYAGTSMATPHVAALAALILSRNSSLTPDQVKNYITANARAFPATCSGCGTGIIDAQRTLQAVTGTPTNTPPVANFTFTSSGLTANFTDTSTDSDGTIASRSWNFGDGGTSTATSPSHSYAAAGTYSVALTVTDNGGATNTRTQSVTVSSTSSNVLSNGVAATGLAATTGNTVTYTMVVPSGASNLRFVIAGGTGDADLYVKFGSAPTTTTYDCRPYLNGNSETCTFATPSVGTYYVVLRAYASFSGVSLTGSYSTGTTGGTTFTNSTPMTIADLSTVNSTINVTGISGNAPATLKVGVNITHTYRGDLRIDLIAPNGTSFRLKNSSGSDSAANVVATYTVNASAVPANGIWTLRVADVAAGDSGTLNSWNMQF